MLHTSDFFSVKFLKLKMKPDSTSNIKVYYYIPCYTTEWKSTLDKLYTKLEFMLDDHLDRRMTASDSVEWYILLHLDVKVPKRHVGFEFKRVHLSSRTVRSAYSDVKKLALADIISTFREEIEMRFQKPSRHIDSILKGTLVSKIY